ncbi:hypothetical protein CDAR_36281 [Caerostris darwini]|uniref:Uncharacterized protein n=1 Tax=Caerostris darwini TaxID=1538125 RepID=A0AAV4R7F5_9ARAC|nr:hypothetical protein CDAR_36281 [Caerostris darwini]
MQEPTLVEKKNKGWGGGEKRPRFSSTLIFSLRVPGAIWEPNVTIFVIVSGGCPTNSCMPLPLQEKRGLIVSSFYSSIPPYFFDRKLVSSKTFLKKKVEYESMRDCVLGLSILNQKTHSRPGLQFKQGTLPNSINVGWVPLLGEQTCWGEFCGVN